MQTLIHWRDFFQFLKKTDYLDKIEGVKNKFLLTFNTLLLQIIIFIPLIILFALYSILTGDINESMLENVEKLYHPIILYSLVAIFEEFAYRGFLTKFKPLLFSISITGIISYYYKKIVFSNMFFEYNGLIETAILAIIVFTILYLLGKKYSYKLSEFWDNNFKSIVYVSAFLFAFMHFFNSVNLEMGSLKTIIFQFISGLLLSFVRIRSGIFYAILLHFTYDIFLTFF